MSTTLALHAMTAGGRTGVMDSDLDRLADEHPDLRPVFEETQFLRKEVERLMEDIWRLQDENDLLK